MRRFAAALVAVALLTACGPDRPESEPPPPAPPNPADSFSSSTTYETVARPTHIRIPSLKVDSKIIDLGLQPDGEIEVPSSVSVAGWYDGGPRPGQDGPAVILGHVDSSNGPGIFVDLHKVKTGTVIEVDRADGSTATFKISKLSRVAKTRFPTDLVYAPSLDPTLRLVTCGGTFDQARGSYRDNVIAYADAV
ncbi:class F sortase [Paractinoplanes lichenicola]|uniref:Class F sortase n=1 Tax=Paractinoplanes lichenicola TaxID=2802976 RepID=A0ABS1VWC0_9ACTN|nr:class F sortase [Actinoplanes lichenicola]MBL7258782.1 class F sortase [Actinoplanes lichenicola]